MITGTFSLVHQLMGMHSFPSLGIKHTSTVSPGQIYIGLVNWLLMIGTIAVVGGFGSSTSLTLAYGVSRLVLPPGESRI
jgi:KUP system potassium uptake protein